jgi:hypothetical protein
MKPWVCAHGAVIRVHTAEGNAVEVRRAFRRYAETVRTELALEPSFELRSLVAWFADAPTLSRRRPGDDELCRPACTARERPPYCVTERVSSRAHVSVQSVVVSYP